MDEEEEMKKFEMEENDEKKKKKKNTLDKEALCERLKTKFKLSNFFYRKIWNKAKLLILGFLDP